MKYLLFFALFVSGFLNAQDLNEIRQQYPISVESAEITSKLNGELSDITKSSKPELQVYKGAVLTLMAKFVKSKKEKKQYFKDGVALIENAINASPKNIELRYIRLSVQENSPRFLGYQENIEADKLFILENYASISSKEVKSVLHDFILKSKNFSETEKSVIKKS